MNIKVAIYPSEFLLLVLLKVLLRRSPGTDRWDRSLHVVEPITLLMYSSRDLHRGKPFIWCPTEKKNRKKNRKKNWKKIEKNDKVGNLTDVKKSLFIRADAVFPVACAMNFVGKQGLMDTRYRNVQKYESYYHSRIDVQRRRRGFHGVGAMSRQLGVSEKFLLWSVRSGALKKRSSPCREKTNG